MQIKITKGNGWYSGKVGEIFEVYQVDNVGTSFSPETGYTIDPIQSNVSLRYVSEFDCIVITQ